MSLVGIQMFGVNECVRDKVLVFDVVVGKFISALVVGRQLHIRFIGWS